MDIIYERAFGGIDTKGSGWCAENPLGKGFYGKKNKEVLDNAPLPNLEDPRKLINDWEDHPNPVGFGFYSRAAMPRSGYVGTYDEKWQKERSPDPPEDFRFDYYNGAHPDLQVEGYLRGDEGVELINLTPEGKSQFMLPGTRLSCIVIRSEKIDDRKSATEEEVILNLDTLCLIPNERRLYMVWRGLFPIQDLTALEVAEVNVTEAKVKGLSRNKLLDFRIASSVLCDM